MKYTKPPIPFKRLKVIPGGSIILKTLGKFLVIPTGDPDVLPEYNEYTLDSNRLPLEIGTYTLTDELKNLIKPWIALYDPAKTVLNFFLFTHKPKKLQYTVSKRPSHISFQTVDGINFTTSDGKEFHVRGLGEFITSLVLFPDNGLIYYGQITHCDLIRDYDSDMIPDCIGWGEKRFVTADGNYFTVKNSSIPELYFSTSDGNKFQTADGNYFTIFNWSHFEVGKPNEGSLYKFLEAYDMVI